MCILFKLLQISLGRQRVPRAPCEYNTLFSEREEKKDNPNDFRSLTPRLLDSIRPTTYPYPRNEITKRSQSGCSVHDAILWLVTWLVARVNAIKTPSKTLHGAAQMKYTYETEIIVREGRIKMVGLQLVQL